MQWWYAKENEIIDYIGGLLAFHPYAGPAVERGSFKGLRRMTYGRSQHVFLNYLIYYAVHEQNRVVDVINMLQQALNLAVRQIRLLGAAP